MHYIRLLICQSLRLCIQVTSSVCGGGKSIFHVGVIVGFTSERFLLLMCPEPLCLNVRADSHYNVLAILEIIEILNILEENLQYSKITEHLKHFNIHMSDRKQLYRDSIDHSSICQHTQSPKAIPNLSLPPSTKHFQQPVSYSSADICSATLSFK